jgi:hypothetical protein
MSTYFEGLITDGVYQNFLDAMIVKANGGFTVSVGTGKAVNQSRWIKNDAIMALDIDPSHAVLNRYDTVIIRTDLTTRTVDIIVVKGIESSVPVVAELVRSDTQYDRMLASIYIPAGSTQVEQQYITDTRPNTTVCGFVSGIIEQVDTTDLYLQWQDWADKQKANYDMWFSDLTEDLTVDTHIVTSRLNMEMTGTTYEIPSVLNYNDVAILGVYVNGHLMTLGDDYAVSATDDTYTINFSSNYVYSVRDKLELIVTKSVIGGETETMFDIVEATEDDIDEIIADTYSGTDDDGSIAGYSEITDDEISAAIDNAFGGG